MGLFFKKEQRRYYRAKPDKQYPVRVDVNGEDFLDIFDANDISQGGIGVTVPHRFKGCSIDKPVSLIVTLPLPIEHCIYVSGTIRHISQKRFGIIFMDLKKTDKQKIFKYIEFKLKDEPWFTRFKYRIGIV